jgi:hypothetical protein
MKLVWNSFKNSSLLACTFRHYRNYICIHRNKTKLLIFPPSKKTKLLFFWIERKNYSSFRPLAPPHAAQKLHASMGWKILTVDLTPCGWVASHPASKFASIWAGNWTFHPIWKFSWINCLRIAMAQLSQKSTASRQRSIANLKRTRKGSHTKAQLHKT